MNGPSRAETAVVALRFDPSPPAVTAGRRFLYDADISGHGDSACASCHIFGDMDDLGWDLGDPFGTVVSNQNPFRLGPVGNPVFHPLKGPMTTQTLRGMASAGPMHWRGDRTGGAGAAALDEDAAFKKFNPAFVGLLGNASQLSAADLQDYTDFILTVRLPPNPIRPLTNAATAAQGAGNTVFHSNNSDGSNTCQNCHRDPLGTDGFSTFEGEPQEFKIAHMRNLYQKVGMFGFPSNVAGLPSTNFQGDQIRGFGFLHDGSVATVFLFLNAGVFNLNNTQRTNLEQFGLAFDTGLQPAVGQQVSIGPASVNDAGVTGRIDLLIARADAGDCDLTVKGNRSGAARGWVYVGGGNFQPDRNADAVVAKSTLLGLAATAGQEQTYLCVPPGNGTRIGVDRDRDGAFDRTEIEAGSDPADACVVPGGGTTNGTIITTSLSMKDDNVSPISLARRRISFKADTRSEASAHRIAVPADGSGGDPRTGGGTLRVYNSDSGPGMPTDDVTVDLAAGLWSALGSSPITGYRYDNPDPNGPIKRVMVKADRIQVKGGKANWSYTLDEDAQGRVAVRLTLGSGAAWCAETTARVSGVPPTSAASDHQDAFTAQPKSPAPAVCPPTK